MMARIDQVLAGEKSWGAYSLDVVGHLGLGLAYSLPVVALANRLNWQGQILWLMGFAAAFTGGFIREWVQFEKTGYEPAKLHLFDRSLDTVQHALGVPVAVLIVSLIW